MDKENCACPGCTNPELHTKIVAMYKRLNDLMGQFIEEDQEAASVAIRSFFAGYMETMMKTISAMIEKESANVH